MGYNLRIVDEQCNTKRSPIWLPEMGATYPIGGSDMLELSITYNYAPFFKKAFESEQGIKILHNTHTLFSIPIIVRAISKLTDDATDNYWDATEGNSKKALQDILWLSAIGYDGVWKVE